MNIEKLSSEVTQQQHVLKELESKRTHLEARMVAAKDKARAARRAYKKLRKAAKRAKMLFLNIRAEVQQQQRIVTKGQKQMVKAFRKAVLAEKVGDVVPSVRRAGAKPVPKPTKARPARAAVPNGKGTRPEPRGSAVLHVAHQSEGGKRVASGVSAHP